MTGETVSTWLFNALIGNDDDHPRNHAVIWHEAERRWRLSPAFDIVPSAGDAPRTLAMQLSNSRFDICRDALLADARFFGFAGQAEAESEMQVMRQRLDARFAERTNDLPGEWRVWLAQRIEEQYRVLLG